MGEEWIKYFKQCDYDNLIELNLNSNELVFISFNCFQKKLTKLNLSNNKQIKSINDLRGFTQLNYLDLSGT